eukprot:scaffold1597_cov181-Alexandrium_tamarense.AAC.10
MKGRVIARSRLTNAECCHTETPTTGDDVDDNLIVDEFYYVPNSIRLDVCELEPTSLVTYDRHVM